VSDLAATAHEADSTASPVVVFVRVMTISLAKTHGDVARFPAAPFRDRNRSTRPALERAISRAW
jgi:hypothetical protein